jgi:hypothetical protein
VNYRWDFGDETGHTNFFNSSTVGHTYETCGTFTIRVEAVNSWGNRAISSLDVNVTEEQLGEDCVLNGEQTLLFLPFVTVN